MRGHAEVQAGRLRRAAGPVDPDVGRLGNFTIGVDPRTLKVVLDQVTPNPDFGRMQFSNTQENVDSRRTVRLKLRITF